MKAYKGFDENLQCRGFQYEIGGEYETETAKACETGFHACEQPIDVFRYYPPATSRYCEVEQSGDLDKGTDDSKVASSKIKIGAEIGIAGVVNAQIEFVKNKCKKSAKKTAGDSGSATAGRYGSATAGDSGSATAGESGAATAGFLGSATAGRYGAATAGFSGSATAGESGSATAGEYGSATAGYSGSATAGYSGSATAGESGAATSRGSVSVGRYGVGTARGNNVKIRGGIGSILVCAVESEMSYKIQTWAAAVVDGEKIKADTWYTVKDGEFVEVEE